jgi:hypothetical protein
MGGAIAPPIVGLHGRSIRMLIEPLSIQVCQHLVEDHIAPMLFMALSMCMLQFFILCSFIEV